MNARNRDDILDNIKSVSVLMDVAMTVAETELPVRLIAIPEGLFQGFNDEIFDMAHSHYLRNIAIDIPGRETEELGKKTRQYTIPASSARHAERTAGFPVSTSTGHSSSTPSLSEEPLCRSSGQETSR